MPTCQRCGEDFPNLYHDGKTIKDFSNRKYCIKCRPIGATTIKRLRKTTSQENYIVCSSPLKGRQRQYCSISCKSKLNSSYPRQKDRAVIRKLKLIEMGGGACSICGYNKNISCIHFHHVDPSTKSFRLDQRAISNRTWEVVVGEFKKCILVCGNCHFELHHPEMDFEILKNQFANFDVF